MFAKIVVLTDMCRNRGDGGIEKRSAKRQSGDVFQHVGVFDGLGGGFSPGERRVTGDQNAWNSDRIEAGSSEKAGR